MEAPVPRLSTTLMAALVFGVLRLDTAQAAESLIDSGGTNRDFLDARLAHIAAYHGRYTEAVERMDRILARSPNFAGGYMLRANYLTMAARYPEALENLNRVEQFHPETTETRLVRAIIALRRHDPGTALASLHEIPQLPMLTLWKRNDIGLTVHGISYAYAYTSIAEQLLGHNQAAADAFRQEMAFETVQPWYILGEHCFLSAVTGLLDMAELTCSEAIAKQTHDTGDYDSLGLAHLKMGKFKEAIDDYTRSLYDRADLTVSLYGRGIARHASGDKAGGDADIAAAKTGEPDIVRIMTDLGVKPG
jgi:tetratricopeptide (TPR) repeat protein